MPTTDITIRNNTYAYVSPGKAILTAGSVTGILDALAAMVQGYLMNGVQPEQVWKYVASGAAGVSAFSGGAGMVVLGLTCHFLIAFIFSTLFFYLYPRTKALPGNVYVKGMVWGLVVWAVMHFVVIPMSATPPRRLPFSMARAWPQILIHLFFVGLPMAWIIHRFYNRRR